MTDLQAAAERLRTANGDTSNVKAYREESESWVRDNAVVARAYLAEHDPSPVTPEALAAMGFTGDGSLWIKEINRQSMMVDFDDHCIDYDYAELPWLNLGQLRRLVGVLEGK